MDPSTDDTVFATVFTELPEDTPPDLVIRLTAQQARELQADVRGLADLPGFSWSERPNLSALDDTLVAYVDDAVYSDEGLAKAAVVQFDRHA